MPNLGFAGKIARAFINSKLTPLIVGASLLLGLFAVKMTPREEEPQIVVPMVDIYLPLPGSSPQEVQERVVKPFEGKLWEIKGVEYLYSMSRPGMGIITVRFLVGQPMEESLVKLYNKVMSNRGVLPPGAGEPLVVPKSIDDVPILALTLWSERYDHGTLRGAGPGSVRRTEEEREQRRDRDQGGAPPPAAGDAGSRRGWPATACRRCRWPAPCRRVMPPCRQASFSGANRETLVETGGFLDSAEAVKRLVVGVHGGKPVYLADVAQVRDGLQEPEDYVFMGLGPGAAHKGLTGKPRQDYPAVTISVAKRKGANATWVAEDLVRKVESLKGKVIPSDVQVTVTRNYGETAREKNNELLFHMFLAAISVTILIALFMGWRAGAVAAIAIPVTLALTMLIFYLIGYTLNRITLFALIFSIGILVDDAIVVVENIHRYFTTTVMKPLDAAIKAVDEIGNPTVLATFAVIASILPMGFVGGLMGPYMRPIPVGASMAMLFSMLIAFIVTPYFAFRFMKGESHHGSGEAAEDSRLTAFYRHWMGRLIHEKSLRYGFLAAVVVLLLLSCSLILFKAVTVKMLPFDNKNELQVIIDAPDGTPLEQTARMAREMGDALRSVPEVTDFQTLYRHQRPLQLQRPGAALLSAQGSESGRHPGQPAAQGPSARTSPTTSPSGSGRWSRRLPTAMVRGSRWPRSRPDRRCWPPWWPRSTAPMMPAVPALPARSRISSPKPPAWWMWTGTAKMTRRKVTFAVDQEKAALSGIAVEDVARTLAIALGGQNTGLLHLPKEKEPVYINLRLPAGQRSSVADLSAIYVPGPKGNVPLSQLVRVIDGQRGKDPLPQEPEERGLRDRRRGRPDRGAGLCHPEDAARRSPPCQTRTGTKIEVLASRQPWSEEKLGMKWDGEWHITYEVFRDLGIAFGAVMVLIYILVVAWFKDFTTPLVIMAPIPLTLIGILPGHALFGAFFTATSMIGFIALAGIIVRNSIILIDFAEMKRREGMALDEAIIEAGAVRFRPMLLTGAAVVVGSFVIVFDPIFQGLALAMMFGEIASTTLSRVTIPILYYLVQSWKERHHAGEEKEMV